MNIKLYMNNQEKEIVKLLFLKNPKLEEIGFQKDYLDYLKTIFPESKIKTILFHGTDVDNLSVFKNEYKGSGSGSPHVQGEIYTSFQPWSVLPYMTGVGTQKDRKWIVQYFEVKRLIDKENRNNKISLKNINIIHKLGKYKGKRISELKSEYNFKGNRLEFVKEIYGLTENMSFFDWLELKKKEFKKIWNKRTFPLNKIIIIKVNIQNPIISKNNNTIYTEFIEEAKKNKDDGLIMYENKDAFTSDVVVIFNPSRIWILGSKKDMIHFRKFIKTKKEK